jgi:hypothetical protein
VREPPAHESPEAAELVERRRPTYVHISPVPGQPSAVSPWFMPALALALALLLGLALYAMRYEYFVMANGGYILRTNRFTGNVCYIPADPEWERALASRQGLLNRCGS